MKFNELNAEQQAAAIEIHRDINVDHQDWHEYVKCTHHSNLEAVGFDGVESAYSGFWSQGDGASFTASSLDIEKFLRSQKRWTYYRVLHEMIRINELWVKVVRTTHRYCHENTTQAELHGEHYLNLTPRQEKFYEELEKEIDAYITNAGQEYYSALNTSYNNMTSDEEVKESIIANEMEFEEDPRESCVTYL
ncbi:Phage protein [Yersinia phage fHe-Yen9-03]|uniref:Phage protein n=1 Tax=Yersinia phage fHe-Yen9-03 TaxID=2052743 RepID=A0A2C9D0J0_9CAUD|nr:Phage protein [Yersinia phage fHe-Yen9-03]